MEPITFDGAVAIVTGAGRGLGRAYAEMLAARGARVVVNDAGVSMDGRCAPSAQQAQGVAGCIVAAGGTARPDGSDVATEQGARLLVERAIDEFGRIDIVVNNAGIYTMDEFPDVELDVMRRQFDVHVGGTFNVTRAAWPHLKASGEGRVVITTSTGALGADNMVAYGAAKAAVLAMGRALAHIGRPHGIRVNMIAPLAMTRMMAAGAGIIDEVPEDPVRSPQLVAPLVTLLCHRACLSTGETYISGMGRSSRLFIAENEGYTHRGSELTPEEILSHWHQVSGTNRHAVLGGTMEQSEYMNGFTELSDEPRVETR